MVTGYMASKGIRAHERRVASAMQMLHPQGYAMRQHGVARLFNPKPYVANYFGNKLHMDRTEKLFPIGGLTHIAGIDGFSRYIVGHVVMPVKNNIVIYDQIMKKCYENFGIFDCLRVDHGLEWCLSLDVQDRLRNYRYDQTFLPSRKTPSKESLRIERYWGEVNDRVNYPIKNILRGMLDEGIINVEDPLDRFVTSVITQKVAQVCVYRSVLSWNHHRVSGKHSFIIHYNL